MRLIESALIVFAQRGIGASVIQDVRAEAEVSQGSFYNHFRTNEELLAAVAEELGNEIATLVETVVGEIDDPMRRIATAIRSFLHVARSYRVVARFLSGVGLNLASKGSVIHVYLPRDLAEGQKRGLFDMPSIDIAVDVIIGAGQMAIHRMASSRTSKDYPEKVTSMLLRSFGVSAAMAARLTALPLPTQTVPSDSLLARAQARLRAAEPHGV